VLVKESREVLQNPGLLTKHKFDLKITPVRGHWRIWALLKIQYLLKLLW